VSQVIAACRAEVTQLTFREVFTRVFQLFEDPVAHRYAYGVQTVALHRLDVRLRDPGVPMFREVGIRCALTDGQHTIELGLGIGAADVLELRAGHPVLDDEHGAQVHTPDGELSWQPSLHAVSVKDFGGVAFEQITTVRAGGHVTLMRRPRACQTGKG